MRQSDAGVGSTDFATSLVDKKAKEGHVQWAMWNMICRVNFGILLLSAIAMDGMLVASSAWAYSGDGEYVAEGILLRNRLLALPPFELKRDLAVEYDLEGVVGGWQWMDLHLESDDPIPYWRLGARVSVRIYEKKTGNLVLEVNSRLNSHYRRMAEAGVALKPDLGEWWGRYRYADEQLDRRAVPFSLDVDPVETLKMKYLVKGPQVKWLRKYRMTINVLEFDKSFEGLRGHLQLISTWK